MSEIRVADRAIGEGNPAFIIAEIGVNHNGSVDRAKKLIDAAAVAGADAVKFQKRSLPDVYQGEILDNPNLGEQSFQYMIPLLRDFEFSEETYYDLLDYAEKKGLIFLCTPFDLESRRFLGELGIPAYKVGSCDMTNLLLLEEIANTGKPMVVSVGMSTQDELDITVQFLKEKNAQFMLLHCNSTYPAPFEDLNLRFIQSLKERYEVPVGYSGHERGTAMAVAAVAIGACAVEKHITLDRGMEGPDHAASLEPEEFNTLVRDLRNLEMALGSGKKIFNRGEILNREVLAKSLVSATSISRGTTITREMVTAKSPGKGLSPQRLFDLVGRVADRDIQQDEAFLEEDLGHRELVQPKSNFKRPWGFKARFHNIDELMPYEPRLLEFHFSDKDLDYEYTGPYLDVELYIHAPEYWYRQMVDLCSEDDAIRQKSIEVIQATIDKARDIAPLFKGTPKVVIHVGGHGLTQVFDSQQLLRNAEESFKQLEFDGVAIYPENLPPRPWYFAGQYWQNAFISSEEMVEFCKGLGLDMCLDISHAQLYCNAFGKRLSDFVKQVKPLVKHVHVSDGASIGGEGLQIGEGEINFQHIFALLEDQEFSWVPEIWRGHQKSARGFLVALERLSGLPNL